MGDAAVAGEAEEFAGRNVKVPRDVPFRGFERAVARAGSGCGLMRGGVGVEVARRSPFWMIRRGRFRGCVWLSLSNGRGGIFGP